MSVAISRLTSEEVDALKSWNSKTEILAVDRSGDRSKIIKISRDVVSCWQLFLRYFNLGALANKTVHLKEVAEYLVFCDLDPKCNNQAFSNICILFNKVLLKEDECLDPVTSIYEQFTGNTIKERTANGFPCQVRVNPATELRHVIKYIKTRYSTFSAIRVKKGDTFLSDFEIFQERRPLEEVLRDVQFVS